MTLVLNTNMENLNSETLLIPNERLLEERIRKFRADGPEKLHFLFDYDGTVIHELDERGNPRPNLIATLREANYLNEEYSREAKALAAHYKAIERDPSVDTVLKKALMQEWWEKHYLLLMRHRLNRSDIHAAMKDSRLRIRAGMSKIFEMAEKAGIPVVIMSANGLGTESIRWHLQNNGLLSDNVRIVSNELEWDEKGYLVGYKQPIVHALNKDETVLTSLPQYEDICHRTNIVLAGDSLHDVGMSAGIDGAKVLNIGFYNYQDDEKLPNYLDSFDAVLTGDSDAKELEDLVRRVI